MSNQKYPLQIAAIRARDYPGGELKIERTLEAGQNYHKFIVSYPSDGLKIFALLTIPFSSVILASSLRPGSGSPLVIFNRGYVEPSEYAIDRQYMRYIDYLARAGFAVFKSDYRGIGESEGDIQSVLSSANAADVLNGLASLQRFCHFRRKEALPHSHGDGNPWIPEQVGDDSIKGISIPDFSRLAVWGHSMGGLITLQCLLANSSFKAASIWAGFIIPFADVLDRWQNSPLERQKARSSALIELFGDPNEHPEAWHDISPFYYLNELPCPVQLHHGLSDQIVPVSDSQRFQKELQKYDKDGGLHLYKNAGHNLNEEDILPAAMKHTILFLFQNI